MLCSVAILVIATVATTQCNAAATYNDGKIPISLSTGRSFAMNILYNVNFTINITLQLPDARAVMIQAVTQGGRVTVSQNTTFDKTKSTTGSSAGIIILLNPNEHSYVLTYLRIEASRQCSQNTSEMVVVSPVELTYQQPIPGGCNLVHEQDYYPLLTTTSHSYSVEIKFSVSNIGFLWNETEPLCDTPSSPQKRLLYDIYYYFLPYTYSNQTCLNCENHAICNNTASANMFRDEISNISYKQPGTFGNKIATFSHSDKPKISLSMSPCSQMIVYISVYDPIRKTSSNYVPAVIFSNAIYLNGIYTTFAKVLLIFLMVLGCVLCIAGHRLFFFELLVFAAMFVGLLTYITLENVAPNLETSEKLGVITGLALFGGCLVFGLWWRFGHGVYFSIIIALVGGFQFSSVIFCTPLINLDFFRNDATFALSFTCVALLYVLLLNLISPPKMCIVTSAFVGSYVVVASLGSGAFFCSMISQIIKLPLHRFTVNYFKHVFVVLPFHATDYGLISCWCVLLVCGCGTQFWLMRNRPAFPECPYKWWMLRNQLQSPPLITAQENEDLQSDVDSLSSQSSSLSSENYEGDVSDSILDGNSSQSLNGTSQSGMHMS